MNKKIIIVEGYLSSGKSTFVLELSKQINVPYLIKDTFKIALCQNIEITGRNESSRFSTVTFDAMMYVVERMFEVGYPIIIEGNFVPAGIKKVDEAGTIKQLIDNYGYDSLTFKFTGDTKVLHRRFVEREETVERGQVNKIGTAVTYDEFNQWCHNLDSFDVGGEIIAVDIGDFDLVDFDSYYELAGQFVKER